MTALTKEQIESSIRKRQDELDANNKWRWAQTQRIYVAPAEPEPVEKFLTVKEVAEILHFCPHTIRAWIRDKRLSAFRLGPGRSEWRFRKSDVMELAAKANR